METWSAWQHFSDQCGIVEQWLSATEMSLNKTTRKERPPGDVLTQVIVDFLH